MEDERITQGCEMSVYTINSNQIKFHNSETTVNNCIGTNTDSFVITIHVASDLIRYSFHISIHVYVSTKFVLIDLIVSGDLCILPDNGLLQ
jgi:hypothetical protein